jgi:uncharacterized membrane protein YccC
MFFLGLLLGVLLSAAGVCAWLRWWPVPAPPETSWAARQAIRDIERRTVQALLREDLDVRRHQADAESTASEVEST